MLSTAQTEALQKAALSLQAADALVIAAGAGMGIDSGLPDFRGDAGFWNAYPALGSKGLRFSAIANPSMFKRNPHLAWGFYGHRLALYRETKPHAGFEILRQWGAAMRKGLFVFTSNVDGQFQKAGFDATRIVEAHGAIHNLQCTAPCSNVTWSAEGFNPQVDMENCALLNELPRCPHCGSLARPNILMFDDIAWSYQFADSQMSRLNQWVKEVSRPAIIEIGAGITIPSVRRMAEGLARRPGATLIRVNPQDAAVEGPNAISLDLGAREALEWLDQLMRHSQT